MNNSNQLPAVVQTAISKIEQLQKDKTCMVFCKIEDVTCDSLFRPEIVMMKTTQEDFHYLKDSGKYMPQKHYTERIGAAAGIVFFRDVEHVEIVPGTKKYVGYSAGKKRMPDGTWRESGLCEYEFDVELRAEKRFLGNPQKYSSAVAKKKCLIELEMHARTKANTGARLRVIRALTGMPIGFKKEELHKAMVFSRIAVNSDKLLENPEMRKVAIEHALGRTAEIFGPQENGNGNGDSMKNVTPEPAALPENIEADRTGVQVDFEQPQEEPAPFEVQTQELTPVEKLREEILTLLENPVIPQDKRDGCFHWLNTNPDSQVEKNLPPVVNYLKNLIDKAQIHKLTGGGK